MDRLEATLSALRPEPRPDFAAELDARAAAGFPRRSASEGASPHSRLLDWLRSLKPMQIALPAGAVAVAAIAIATVVVSNQGTSPDSDGGGSFLSATDETSASGGEAAPDLESAAPSAGAAESYDGNGPYELENGAAKGAGLSETVAPLPPKNAGNAAADSRRKVESSAEITLGTDPAGVADASAKVFDTVHQYRGIVLNSSTSEGRAGDAGAEFELLIPSGKLADALAAFSGIAEVRSRHEATTDITGPTVGVSEHLEDSQARIDSLLGQLAEADDEEEREIVEAELRGERARAAALSAQLQRLDRRANLASVSLRIETGEDSSAPDEEEGGAWGIADAFDDAGGILSTAAAVSLVALAVLGPIALLALLAWLGRRVYTHAARTRALG